jgi:hypothetical protein
MPRVRDFRRGDEAGQPRADDDDVGVSHERRDRGCDT